MRNLKPVLLLEDDEVDAMTVRKAAKELNVINPLIHFVNGEQALDYLRNKSNPVPCVILLDLNMPKLNGIEFLKIIKEDAELRCIPVIAITSSQAEKDKIACFENGVAGYIIKPSNYDDFVKAFKILDLYWTLNELPDNITNLANTANISNN